MEELRERVDALSQREDIQVNDLRQRMVEIEEMQRIIDMDEIGRSTREARVMELRIEIRNTLMYAKSVWFKFRSKKYRETYIKHLRDSVFEMQLHVDYLQDPVRTIVRDSIEFTKKYLDKHYPK